jgi:phosphoribosyl-dephospho-CoA transferase
MIAVPDARTHDLVLFRTRPYGTGIPEWVDLIEGCAWAVVRRQRLASEGMIAAGLRGRERGERVAIDIRASDVVSLVSPESLASPAPAAITNPSISRAISTISTNSFAWFGDRTWGPVGSVGFALATRLPVVRESSDLDLIVRAPDRVSAAEARAILSALDTLPCRVDCLLETANGAVALAEWAASAGGDVLQRTAAGPHLTRDPWREVSTTRESLSA